MSNIKKKIAEELSSLDGQQNSIGHIWELKRLQSLKKWTLTKPSAKDMAEAGFYCPNPELPGSVKCFSCFIELDGWEPTDKPWDEHRKRALALNPPCKFVEIGKKESDLLVVDYLEIIKSVMLRVVNEKCEKNLSKALAVHKQKKTSLRKEIQKMGIS